MPGPAGDLHARVGELGHRDAPGPGPAEGAAVDLAALLGRVGVEGYPGQVLVSGVAAAAADDLLAVGEGGACEPGLRGPAAVQLGQPPALAVGQGPDGGVGAQQLQGGPLVVQGHPAFHDVRSGAHPVVQSDRQPAVPKPQPQLVVLGAVRLEDPLGTAPLLAAHRQGGPDEARPALYGVLLAPVERGLEGPVVGQRAYGQRLGVGESDPWPPVEVQQLVVGGEVKGITAVRPGQNPGATVLGDLQHAVPHRHEQTRTGALNHQHHQGPLALRATPVDNSLAHEPMSYRRVRAPVVEPRRRNRRGGALVTQQVPSTEPQLAGVRNFRDVGGLPTADGRRVRQGVLFRSGHLAHATAEDSTFLDSLGLHTIFDFRNASDQKLEGPDVELPGVRNVNLPLSDPADGAEFWKMVRDGDLDQLRDLLSDGKGANRMIASYRTIITERTSEHSRVLHSLAEDSVPALMHCAAGKDRAGLSIAVTLLALRVERDAIVADYLESNARHRRYKVHRSSSSASAYSPEVMELLSPLFDARAEYLEAAFDTIEEKWGGVEAYLEQGLGITPETRERLRERLLD